MLFSWWKQRRRRQILAEPFPAGWNDYLNANVVFYRSLSPKQQDKLRDELRFLIAEKSWEGCGDLQMTEEVQVTVAALACLLTLALPEDSYRRVQTILVYPSGYLAPTQGMVGGVPLGGETPVLGEAHYRGPVILSWDDVLEGGRYPETGRNLVFHEFAHQLDMLEGNINGTPPMRSRKLARRWQRVMGTEYERLVAASGNGEPTLLDPYGTTNEAEFFAIATECFFTKARAMNVKHGRLYDLLRDFYRQNPVEWAIG